MEYCYVDFKTEVSRVLPFYTKDARDFSLLREIASFGKLCDVEHSFKEITFINLSTEF